MSNNHPECLKEATAILQGFISSHPEADAALADAETWVSGAQDVLRSRQLAILMAFSDDTLREIAAGRIDMGTLYQQLYNKK